MEYSYIFTNFPSQYFFFDSEEIIFENFNIFENNIISVELAQGTKVSGFSTTLSFLFKYILQATTCFGRIPSQVSRLSLTLD